MVDGERVLLDKLKLARAILDRYAPAQDAERERDAGIEAAARWIDTRRDDFDREHGYEDPDTGALEYGTGPHAEAKREYSFELAEIAEGLRALKSEAARAQLDAAQEKPE
ncbi:hypothetical protein CAL28_10465 [Bordetella genomosp. 11]|uniref:Uncharacterized protein n=1 Tax=Bordetella genomosp. 11 TaxID=1416808 RepID=A0A261UDB2_9BORD|nr:hypothetical protein CAL28_10465 [Bordetella genomosp. 11]